jgi:hypothetical protein
MRVGRSEQGSSKYGTMVRDLILSQISSNSALELSSREDRPEEDRDKARCYQQVMRAQTNCY